MKKRMFIGAGSGVREDKITKENAEEAFFKTFQDKFKYILI